MIRDASIFQPVNRDRDPLYQTGKLGNGAPDIFPDINFCALGMANFLWGKIFAPLNAHVFFVFTGLHVYAVHACTMAGIIIE